ncbi:MAG: hypothetical protein ACI92I_000102 [Acidimicrobiales bacterium]|jgi:hypothetical protein
MIRSIVLSITIFLGLSGQTYAQSISEADMETSFNTGKMVDSRIVDQEFTRIGGTVPLMLVMFEDPNVAELEKLCLDVCIFEFTAVEGDMMLSGIKANPDDMLDLHIYKAYMALRHVEAHDTGSFFHQVRKIARGNPSILVVREPNS